MKNLIKFLLLILISNGMNAQSSEHPENPNKSLAYKWVDIVLEVTANDVDRDGALPTIQSRSTGIIFTAMYDAWAAYDEKAVGTMYGGTLRRPAEERTQKNKETAISYAIFNVLMDLHYRDSTYIRDQMKALGYQINNTSLDRTTPEGIGNLVAKAIIEYRHHDGANQLGDEIGGTNGKRYSDYTFYKPVNTWDHVIDPDRWHPLPFVDGKGKTFFVDFVTPQWYRVKPFGLESSAQFRAPEPPRYGSAQLKKEVDEVMDLNANLDHQRKTTIEFMRDGPRSTGQAGHWLRFAQLVSIRDKNQLDTDVKLFFTVAVTAMDAFIACWDTKRFYDTARPWTQVRLYYKGQKIKGWGGPDKGTLLIPAEEWHPYSPANFVSPPFPAYISGHSTVSGACAKVLELFTGSDHFGVTESRICGALTETPGDPVSLPLPTFSATAELAGISRVLGGYHIQTDNIEGLRTGRSVGEWDYKVTQGYINGTKELNSEAFFNPESAPAIGKSYAPILMASSSTCPPGCTKDCCKGKDSKSECKPGCTKDCCKGKDSKSECKPGCTKDCCKGKDSKSECKPGCTKDCCKGKDSKSECKPGCTKDCCKGKDSKKKSKK